ncbi:hypothetical protein AAFF_G00140870 [Aldrovandia affinis]|uniref:Synaptopodin 2-like protein n=1 Tax=Aldrovandia affinis TaxID=143900 RepID=A0AAD7X316_9TELE|nr:hypothetical protein AAFF_G00140870 [Aldrovandia affinis]
MVVEEVVITLSGGAPWGFRLQGGAEHKKPLQVAKVRKRSKACRAGLREGDELVSINESSCGGLSHAQAMNLIDSAPGTLHIRVRRAPVGFQSVVLLTRAPSPRIDKEYRAAMRSMAAAAAAANPPQAAVREVQQGALTSPPGSEAYYGETDSDADVTHEKQRRQKRRSPSSSPGRAPGRESAEETSELSGYDSAPDAQAQSPGQLEAGLGVARREVVYQPPQREWSSHTETSTENSSVSADDQSPRDGAVEEDSGFQEPQTLIPLVSPERAKGALQLASRKQMVPMVGPVNNPVDEELTTTYMDKAKQAKLNRGDTMQDKQVKEARTKCRTIASLLTDAPNPHSKGVLMFKKRRQRSKKYTLTSFGSVDEDTRHDSQEEEEEEEDGVFPAANRRLTRTASPRRPTPPGTATTWTAWRRRPRAGRRGGRKTPASPPHPALLPPPPGFIVMNGDPVVESAPRARVVAPLPPPPAAFKPASPQAPPATQLPDLPSSNVLNRTARPFAPGFISHRAATAPVVFRPNVAKKSRPATALMITSPPFPSPPSEMTPAMSPASPPHSVRPAPVSAPPAGFLPPPTVSTGPFFTPPTPTAPAPAPHSMSPPVVHPLAAPRAPQMSAALSAPVMAASAAPAAAFAMSHEQRAAAASGRTGILQEALRHNTKKAMFTRPEEKKTSPNPDLLSMVQTLDERPRAGPEAGFEYGPEEDLFNLGAEACNFMKTKVPPPVAPKPRVIHEAPQIPQMEGRGAELFARRQSRKDMYVVDNAPKHYAQPGPTFQSREISPTPSLPSHWKYSSNIRAPPPIGYNPLLSPSCPPGAQRGARASETAKGRVGSHKEGIKAVDAMRRQPYQLNSAMFSFGGGAAQPAAYQQYPTQHQGGQMMGSSLGSPRQIPVKAARVYEIRRFSTPTPMSAPTTLTPTIIAPRSATTLGEPLCRSDDMASRPLPRHHLLPTLSRQELCPHCPKYPPFPSPTLSPPRLPCRCRAWPTVASRRRSSSRALRSSALCARQGCRCRSPASSPPGWASRPMCGDPGFTHH